MVRAWLPKGQSQHREQARQRIVCKMSWLSGPRDQDNPAVISMAKMQFALVVYLWISAKVGRAQSRPFCNVIITIDEVKDHPEPHYSKLPPSVAEAIRRPVEAWNVFVLGDADMVELDAKRLGPQEQQSVANDIKTARPIVERAAADRNITTEETAKVLDAGLHAAATLADNINTRQAQQVVAGTVKNLLTQLVRHAYLTCLAIAEPKTDDDRLLVVEYKKGIARHVGTGFGDRRSCSYNVRCATHASHPPPTSGRRCGRI